MIAIRDVIQAAMRRDVQQRPSHRGFTLIELLVVIAIIALLCSMLFGAITMVRRSARQAVCTSNLRQWGMAISEYATDNRANVPMSFLPGWSIAPSIGVAGVSVERRRQLNIGSMGQYLVDLNRLDATTWTYSGVWNCPDWYGADASGGFTQRHVGNGGDGSDYLTIGYSYYGQVNHWIPDSHPSNPEDLTDRRLDPNKLVMTDVVWWWVGPNGAGTTTPFETNHATAGNPSATAGFRGQNQLFGDGRVTWRRSSEFDIAGMNALNGSSGASAPHPTHRAVWSVHGNFYY